MKADDAVIRLEKIHSETEARFGRDVPQDALLLDVLACIEVEADDVWRWKGTRNNHGIPTVSMPLDSGRRWRSERSLARYLGLAFGVLKDDQFGTFYPANGDADDMNPWHRVLRESDLPVGNPDRYQWSKS